VTGVQKGERELVRELQRGDVVLMVFFAREENGWNFSSTRNRTAAGSEIASAACWAARAGGGRRAGQEGAMRCGGAGGARNWRGGAAEAADGGGQRSSGEVVERGKEQECGFARGNRRREKFTACIPKPKRGARAGGKQLLAVDSARGGSGGQRRDASARGASKVGRAAGGRAGGQLAQEEWRGGSWRPGETPTMGGGWRCRETERGKTRGRKRGPVHKFCQSSRSLL
jgi:hypothetical protein